MKEMKVGPIDIDHHRNGMCGAPFDVVVFDWNDDDGKKRRMVGIVFDEPNHVAVLDVAELAKGNIEFGSNSWRGDHFEQALRRAIDEKMSERYGPGKEKDAS